MTPLVSLYFVHPKSFRMKTCMVRWLSSGVKHPLLNWHQDLMKHSRTHSSFPKLDTRRGEIVFSTLTLHRRNTVFTAHVEHGQPLEVTSTSPAGPYCGHWLMVEGPSWFSWQSSPTIRKWCLIVKKRPKLDVSDLQTTYHEEMRHCTCVNNCKLLTSRPHK